MDHRGPPLLQQEVAESLEVITLSEEGVRQCPVAADGMSDASTKAMLRSKRPIFTVQKHQASRLHYDFRLEIGGVLKSWAIPKGPSLDPSVKRLAVEVEDHDLEYANFEGVIEEGHYGAGPVLVWDTGWLEPLGANQGPAALARMFQAGKLDMHLQGQRLRGGFTLVRMKDRPRQWLLIKQRDKEARPGHEVVQEYDNSVLSDRTIEDLAAAVAAGTLETYRCG
jgi:bifunctional non-homologous end joining protein LigD